MSVNVRYIVSNVDEALPFYTEMLGSSSRCIQRPPLPRSAGTSHRIPHPAGWWRRQRAMPDGRLPSRAAGTGCS
jgi:hypothetical protein